MVGISIDIYFSKSELLRIPFLVLRTIELETLPIFKAGLDCGGVTRAAAQLHRANPEVRIELVTGTTGALLEQVSRYAIEAAFIAERFKADGLEMMPVFRERLVVIAPRKLQRLCRQYPGYDRDRL